MITSVQRKLRDPDAVLLLENGKEFWGHSVGAPLEGTKVGFGEIVFNTALAGYQEVLTDPSYSEQIVMMTYPHQGNYGIHQNDSESEGGPKVAGFIVYEMVDHPSSAGSLESLPSYLKRFGIPALEGIDTRALTLLVRASGVLRALMLSKAQRERIGSRVSEEFAKRPAFQGRDLQREASTKNPYWFSVNGSKTVVAIDFGVKKSLLSELASRDCKVVVLPATASADDVFSYQPDGVFLSNGPGDPQAAPYAVETVKAVLGKVPVFGVCMGHQILALALGASTYKMKFGHRGVNQPVFNHAQGCVEISSHNHGFAVDARTLPHGVKMTHVNLNDDVCEGLECAAQNAFSVQYHPESAPGPHDSSYLFDRFVDRLN